MQELAMTAIVVVAIVAILGNGRLGGRGSRNGAPQGEKAERPERAVAADFPRTEKRLERRQKWPAGEVGPVARPMETGVKKQTRIRKARDKRIMFGKRGRAMPDLDVIVSWSGRTSHAAAEAIHEWLPDVLPGIKPWISSEDIAIGTPWFAKLMGQLEKTGICITCVTRDNVKAPWIFFEAGAIVGKRFGNEPKVLSYLVGVEGAAIGHTPLSQFQWAEATKDGTWKLVKSVNDSLANPFPKQLVEGNFRDKWPSLKRKLEKCISEQAAETPQAPLPAATEPQLSEKAVQILLEAVQDPGGMIYTVNDSVTTNSKGLVNDEDPRDAAAGRSAIRLLTNAGYIESEDPQRMVHQVSDEGYAAAKTLRGATTAATAKEAEMNDHDKVSILEAWLDGQPRERVEGVINFAELDTECKLPPGSAKQFLEKAASENYWVSRKGNTTMRLRSKSDQSGGPGIDWSNPPPPRPF
jgi:TIR domain